MPVAVTEITHEQVCSHRARARPFEAIPNLGNRKAIAARQAAVSSKCLFRVIPVEPSLWFGELFRSPQPRRMPLQMIVHEGRDEVVGVVVALMHAQRQADIGALDRLLEFPRREARLEKTVGLTLVDQKLREAGAVFDQRAGVVFAPLGTIRAEIFFKRILRPVGGQRIDDRGKGRAALEAVGFFSAIVIAPWPPMEWPKMPWRLMSARNCSAIRPGSSSVM